MKAEITMPVLSDTMQTGRLTRWNRAVGEAIKKGEAVAEIETDKAILDVEAFADGFLAGPLAAVGTDIPVRQVIGYIADTREARKTEHPPHPGGLQASPYARALARDPELDLRQVKPGPDGTIHAAPVLASVLAPEDADLCLGPPYTIERPSMLRAAVARNMSATLDTPTFFISSRLATAPLHAAAKQASLSLTLALTRACALTVAEDPWFNHVWTRQGLAKRSRVDVGIAVDTGEGLITPVLRDAAGRPLKELVEDWRTLLGKVKKGRIYPKDYQGASFYLSNLGVFPEVERFNAIVPVGASAILAVAAAGRDGRADFTLSCDHRVIFGADAARFLQRLGKRLEDLSWLATGEGGL
ncbi:2-oxo acid dehydrogenase subunit E2 [Acidithiobacillus sp.]|jgi:pyruvate dehydrogenase E2 component (dihydrolipoamide acetyltransferase)|uniref:2-oxo acid dehydrogenase subunit E2 n=1 Tax=Acidithiobacillus sp. TaxID=1872118 RepID=UPI0025BBBFB6|nr:2-oxo acid dehydrogenase subunit E2 [Acidithiobacillus sp.]MCK9188490.1 2-oxo acid dehydrogenase subunit E2 [Acidithiobacillus sp.]MCK9358911.1 2-oxo acid dehydrogenase subunit E2 [Acidithiobacillus sp.]